MEQAARTCNGGQTIIARPGTMKAADSAQGLAIRVVVEVAPETTTAAAATEATMVNQGERDRGQQHGPTEPVDRERSVDCRTCCRDEATSVFTTRSPSHYLMLETVSASSSPATVVEAVVGRCSFDSTHSSGNVSGYMSGLADEDDEDDAKSSTSDEDDQGRRPRRNDQPETGFCTEEDSDGQEDDDVHHGGARFLRARDAVLRHYQSAPDCSETISGWLKKVRDQGLQTSVRAEEAASPPNLVWSESYESGRVADPHFSIDPDAIDTVLEGKTSARGVPVSDPLFDPAGHIYLMFFKHFQSLKATEPWAEVNAKIAGKIFTKFYLRTTIPLDWDV